MSFLSEYKRLDNLCKDLLNSQTGVTSYINELEKSKYHYELEYRKLKHYRHIRNQIVHENNVYENDVCDEFDTQWIQEFYQRILQQTDPLALIYKQKMNYQSQPQKQTVNSNSPIELPNLLNINLNSCLVPFIITFIVILLALFLIISHLF